MKRIDTILYAALLVFCATPAMAYVGPGPGLSMLGSLFTLIGGIFVALFMVLMYPIRVLLKRRKRGQANPEGDKSANG